MQKLLQRVLVAFLAAAGTDPIDPILRGLLLIGAELERTELRLDFEDEFAGGLIGIDDPRGGVVEGERVGFGRRIAEIGGMRICSKK